jgi:hypothetical protein
MQESSESKVIEGYIRLINTLSPELRRRLVEEIGSGKTNLRSFKKAFGAWDSAETAEDIIVKIKESRRFSRTQDSF